MTFEMSLPTVASFIGNGAMFVAFGYRAKLRGIESRTQRLGLVTKHLSEHTNALERFEADPDSPFSLRDLLLAFSDLIELHETAVRLQEDFDRLARGKLSPDFEQEAGWFRDLNKLAETRLDLRDAFTASVTNGVVASLMMWPDTAKKVAATMSQMATHPSQEVALAAARPNLKPQGADLGGFKAAVPTFG